MSSLFEAQGEPLALSTFVPRPQPEPLHPFSFRSRFSEEKKKKDRKKQNKKGTSCVRTQIFVFVHADEYIKHACACGHNLRFASEPYTKI